MSQGDRRFSLQIASGITDRIINDLAPLCERIQIVGSIRRCKANVGDAEIMLIPIADTDLFGQASGSLFEQRLPDLVTKWHAEVEQSGQKTKVIVIDGLPVELHVSHALIWPVELLIRTGPAELSRLAVTARRQGGYLPSDLRIHADEGKIPWQVWRGPKCIPLRDEREFMNLLGIGWVEPWLRAGSLQERTGSSVLGDPIYPMGAEQK